MKNKLLFIFIYITTSVYSYGQNFNEFTKEHHIWNNQYDLPYRMYKPKDLNKKYPLVILLHGIGERGSDNEKQLNLGVGEFLTKIKECYPSIIVVPQCPYSSDTSNKYYWSNAITEISNGLQFNLSQTEPTIPMKMLMSLISELLNSDDIDKNQVYIGGFSMGGFGVYEILWRMPYVFKAAFPICGASSLDNNKLESYAGKTRIWAFHGYLDDIIPITLGNNTYDAIQKIPASNIKYTIYSNVYHNSWDYAFNDSKLIPWIFGYNDLEKGYYKISTNDSSNESLTNDNNTCSILKFNGNNNQQWFIYDGEIAGTYRICLADGHNKFLTSNGIDIDLKNYTNDNTQLWKILASDTIGLYQIISVQNNLPLSIENSKLLLSTNNNNYKWNISHSKLFIVGNAVGSGWNINNAYEMKLQTDKNGVFKWQGVISENNLDFKFQPTKDINWLPTVNAAYNEIIEPSDQEHKLVINTDYINDYKFGMKKGGIYEVIVNMVSKTMSVTKKFDKVYLVGDATPRGWDSENGIELKKKDENIFEWFGYLKTGYFKFLTYKNTWLYSLSSYVDGQVIIENDSTRQYPIKFNTTLDANFNYKIENSGFYNIRIDLNNESISLSKKDIDKLWITGSALKNDTIEVDLKHLENNSKYTYIGYLNHGTLEYWIKNPFTSDYLFITTDDNNTSVITSTNINLTQDNNNQIWIVPKTSDNYRLAIDIKQLTFRGEIFTPKSTNYYLVGGASPIGWDINKAIPFIQDPNNDYIYKLTTTLIPKNIPNGNQFKILEQKNWWGYSFHPTTYNKTINNNIDIYEEQYGYGGTNDYKWTVNDENAGNYEITLNTLKQTITFKPEYNNKNRLVNGNNDDKPNIVIVTKNNQIQIINNSEKKIDSATLIEIKTGKIYNKELNKTNNFYLGENISKGTYIININQDKSTLTKKIIIK